MNILSPPIISVYPNISVGANFLSPPIFLIVFRLRMIILYYCVLCISSLLLIFVLTLWVLTAGFLLTTPSFTIKVVYDHTHIASYRHWGAGSAGQLRVWLQVLDGRSAKLAGGLPSGPILSGLSRTRFFCKNLELLTDVT